MKSIWTIVRGNYRRNKGAYISMLLLMFVISLAFITIGTVNSKSRRRQNEALKEIDADNIYWSKLKSEMDLNLDKTSTAEIVSNLEKCSVVKYVKHCKSIAVNLQVTPDIIRQCGYLISDNNGVFNFSKYDENNNKIENLKLKKYEICLPLCFKTIYDIHIGDEISIEAYKDKNIKLKIAAFIEDPLMGANNMGIKTSLVNDETMSELEKLYNEGMKKDPYNVYVEVAEYLSIKKKDASMKDAKFEKTMNREAAFSGFSDISISVSQSQKYTMVIVDIFSAIAVSFIVILAVATFIVIGHSINSSIEQDYVNLGIYKSLGLSSRKIRLSLAISYGISTIVGLILGVPVSIPLIKFLGDFITNKSTGLYISYGIDYTLTGIMFLITIIVVIFFVIFKSHKITKVVPVVALNDGQKSVSFSSLLNTKISKKFLNLSLAYRQLSSNAIRYISIIFVTILLSLFLVLMNMLFAWTKDDELISDMMGNCKYDAYMAYHEDAYDDIKEIINKYSDFDVYTETSEYVVFDDVTTNCRIFSKPEFIKSIKEGRTCKYDNEILITPYISDEFDLAIGDSVNVTISGQTRQMIVSGIFDSMVDMGNTFAMSEEARSKFLVDRYAEGYEEIKGDTDNPLLGRYVVFDDNSKAEEIKNALYEKYEYLKESNEDEDTDKDLVRFVLKSESVDTDDSDEIISGIQGMTIFVYILGAVFIIVTISLIANKTMYRERKDYGIYKSVGIPSGKLRSQISVKFMIVCIAGAIIGDIIAYFVSAPILKVIFSQFGITNFEAKFNIIEYIIPIVFLSMIGFICAYVNSRKIKTIQPRILIVE